MAAVDDTIGELIDRMDVSDLDTTNLLAAIIASDEKMSKAVSKTMEKSISASLKLVTSSFRVMHEKVKSNANSKAFTIGDILGVSERVQKEVDKQYTSTTSKMMDKLSTLPSLSSIPASIKPAANDKRKDTKSSSTISRITEKPINALMKALDRNNSESSFKSNAAINIGGFSDKALDQLSNRINIHQKEPGDVKNQNKGEGFGLGKFAVAGGLILGGLYALYKGISSSSQWMGTLKLIGKSMLLAGSKSLKMLAKPLLKMGGGVMKIIKAPLVKLMKGMKPILNLAIKPLAAVVSNLTKSSSKLLAVITKPLKNLLSSVKAMSSKVIGKIISPFKSAIDNISKVSSKIVSGVSKIFRTVTKPLAKIASKVGGGGGIFNKIATGVKKLLKNVGPTFLKRIPGISAIIGFFFAKKRLERGDIFGAILEMTSGLASIVPIVGTAVGFGIDAFLAFRDFKKGSNSDIKPTRGPSILGKLGQKLRAFGGKVLKGLYNVMASIPGLSYFVTWDDATGIGFRGADDIIDDMTPDWIRDIMSKSKEKKAVKVKEKLKDAQSGELVAPSKTDDQKAAKEYYKSLSEDERKKVSGMSFEEKRAHWEAEKDRRNKGALKDDLDVKVDAPKKSFRKDDMKMEVASTNKVNESVNQLGGQIDKLADVIDEKNKQEPVDPTPVVIDNTQTIIPPNAETAPIFREPSVVQAQRSSFWNNQHGMVMPA